MCTNNCNLYLFKQIPSLLKFTFLIEVSSKFMQEEATILKFMPYLNLLVRVN